MPFWQVEIPTARVGETNSFRERLQDTREATQIEEGPKYLQRLLSRQKKEDLRQ